MRPLRVLILMAIAGAAHSENVTLTGSDAFLAAQKMTCGTTMAGVTRYGIFEGRAWSRVPGEKDRHLFNVLGINVRQCGTVEDPTRGRGFRSVSREIMAYLDPETGEMLDTWMNPWTGKEVPVIHVANDPVNMRQIRYEFAEEGDAAATVNLRRYGDVTSRSAEIPLFYRNPLGGDYQPFVGGTYHAMEIFDSFYDSEALLDAEIASIGQSHLAWVRVAKWLPWLEMGDRPGWMIFNATGFSTFDKDRVPEKLTRLLDERYAGYWTPPPLDDERPNETSWTVFKKFIDAASE